VCRAHQRSAHGGEAGSGGLHAVRRVKRAAAIGSTMSEGVASRCSPRT
jgi:hypothetical protein